MTRSYETLQCLAVWCSLLQCVAVRCSVVQCDHTAPHYNTITALHAACCSVLQCGAVWCNVVQCGAVCCSVGVLLMF